MPAFLVPLLIQLIASFPEIVKSIGDEWETLKRAGAEGRDLTKEELLAISNNATLSAAAFKAIINSRTDWA